jgi:hypothetical protein
MKIFIAYILDTTKDLFKRFKKAILVLLSIGVIGGGAFGINMLGGLTDAEKIDALPKEQKLKVDKDKVLDEETIKDIRCEKNDSKSCTDLGNMKVYLYISDAEVPASAITIKDGEKNVKIDEDISKRTSNGQFFKIKETATSTIYQANFYGGVPFYKETDGKFYQTETATTTIEAFDLQTKPDIIGYLVRAVLATDYPVTAGDGYIQYYLGSGTTWAAIRAGTAGTATDYTNWACQTQEYSNGGTSFAIARAFMAFDTSAIDDDATIDTASISITTQSSSSRGDVYIDGASQPSTTALTNADYDLVSGTAYSAKLSPAGDNTKNTVSFNATGLAGISKTGYTKISIRGSNDYDNVDVGGSYNATSGFYTSEQSGTGYDPYLTVTYSAGGGTTAATPNNDIIIFE